MLAGDYYVKVYGYQGAKNPNYTLTVLSIGPDRYEDNDDQAIVDASPEGETNSPNLGYVGSELLIDDLTMEDGADWFKFVLGNTGITTDYVAIDAGNLTLEVFKDDGVTPVNAADYVGWWQAVSLLRRAGRNLLREGVRRAGREESKLHSRHFGHSSR